MRAFRPSRFGSLEDTFMDDPAEEEARSLKIQLYARRAEAHQPLFEDILEVPIKTAEVKD